jgi:hypothetical protein
MLPQTGPSTSFIGSNQGVNLLGSAPFQAPQMSLPLKNSTAPGSTTNPVVTNMVKALKGSA